jgi:hypothetical protein
MYEGKNLTPREIFRRALGRKDDELLARTCNQCVDFRDGEDGPIVTHSFFRYDHKKRLDFRLAGDRIYSLAFRTHAMKVDSRRWGIFPRGQTIDLNLSRHDFPRGKGAIRVHVKSKSAGGEIRTRLWKRTGSRPGPAGSASGNRVTFEGLEPGRYEVRTRLKENFDLFLPQVKAVDVRDETVDVALDLTGLYAMDLTLVDESNLARDSSVRPPYTLVFADPEGGTVEETVTGKKAARIGGFRSGRYLASASVWASDRFFLSAPVEVDFRGGTPAPIVELRRDGKPVSLTRTDRASGRDLYGVRVYTERGDLWASIDAYHITQIDCIVLPPGLFRLEFREHGREEAGPAVTLDTGGGAAGFNVSWNAKTGETRIRETDAEGNELEEEEEEE